MRRTYSTLTMKKEQNGKDQEIRVDKFAYKIISYNNHEVYINLN